MLTNWIFIGLGFIFLWLAEVAYFRVAARLAIIDKPNERSSHAHPIIRGGGIIFFVSVIAWFFTHSLMWPWFMLAVGVVAVVSFADDLVSVNFVTRIVFQTAAMLLVFYQADVFRYPLIGVIFAFVVGVGTLNAFNFMDGINGITGIYSLVTLLTMMVIQLRIPFTELSFLVGVMMSSSISRIVLPVRGWHYPDLHRILYIRFQRRCTT